MNKEAKEVLILIFLDFIFLRIGKSIKRFLCFLICPNPYFLGFHFPTRSHCHYIEQIGYIVLILIFLDFIFLHYVNGNDEN